MLNQRSSDLKMPVLELEDLGKFKADQRKKKEAALTIFMLLGMSLRMFQSSCQSHKKVANF